MSDNPFQAPAADDASARFGAVELSTSTVTLRYVHPLQAGKVLGILYFFLGMIFVPFILLGSLASGDAAAAGAGIGLGLLMIVGYTIGGFLGGVLAAAIYNLAAKTIGGMRFDFE